jgi:mono/diheme cytochrome c family protein
MPDARILTRAGAFAASISLLSVARGDMESRASAGAADAPSLLTVRPIMAKYCFECHGPKKQESGLNLSSFQDDAAVVAAKKKWKDVWQKVDTRQMPPAGNAEPSAAEREKITGYIESILSRIDGRGAEDPGRVVIRRLNRTEYKNTIRDLLGIEAPVENFPSDDVGYGFDNIGDVLSLPPLLMEKYLATAEKILGRAIVVARAKALTTEHVSGRDLSVTVGGRVVSDPPTLLNDAEMYRYIDVPKEGRYVVRIRAAGDQAGSEPVRIALRVDGADIDRIDVRAPRGEPASYERDVTLSQGQRRIGVAFLNDENRPGDPKPNDRNLIVHYLEIDGPKAPTFAELPETHRRIFIARPDAKTSKRDAASEVLAAFAARAFRRPVGSDELAKLMKLFDMADRRGELFEAAVKVPLEAILVSPYFLFRAEQGRPTEDATGAHAVNDYELASRLSYFLWSSMPDDHLMAVAAKGTLGSPAVLDVEVDRMLRDPKAKALSDNFTSQWLQIRRLENVTPDAARFPSFDEPLREAMAKEPVMLFDAVLRENKSAITLLDADFTFVNERLARHYGLSDVTGSEMRRVTLGDRRRGGVLTMASILASTSTPARTSPVKRGKWVLESILGTPPPPPAPDVGALRENADDKQKLTVRERMEKHRADPNCASCHARMDPIGFGLENYDAIGAWREQDDGLVIDPSAKLPDGQTFRGAEELRQILVGRKGDFIRCLTEKMLTYALGRGVEFSDHATVRKIDESLARQDFRLSALVTEIVKSYPFRYRRNAAH